MISELSNEASREACIELLWRLTAPGGVMVVVERGNRWGSHVANRARQYILDLDPTNTSVVAPCTHSKACPMIEGKGGANENIRHFHLQGKDKMVKFM